MPGRPAPTAMPPELGARPPPPPIAIPAEPVPPAAGAGSSAGVEQAQQSAGIGAKANNDTPRAR
jgi:hypothetical protein